MYRKNRVVVEAPAKINLYLDIVGREPNGYHLIESVMQTVDLCDVITIGHTIEPDIRITSSRHGIPEDSSNLAVVSAKALLGALPSPDLPGGLHIHIDKIIPSQAGLGGGSADAAAVLTGLNQLLDAKLTPKKLNELAASLGSDVPFAMQGGCARVKGMGEFISPIFPTLPFCWLAIAKPHRNISTKEAYEMYDSYPRTAPNESHYMVSAIAGSNLQEIGHFMFNIFEQVMPDNGDTERVKTAMRGYGALGTVMTGSGSAIIGLFDKMGPAEVCVKALQATEQEVYLAAPASYGARVVHES